jgi:4-amino-4-deoxy-L-arabinose transferase-like glycosyltransferase
VQARSQADPEPLGKVWTLLLFGAALSVRLACLAWAPQPPILWDAEAYCHAGASLAAGQETAQVRAFIGQQGPGYPLFLAAIFLVRPNDVWAVRCVQAGLGAFTSIVIALIGRRLAGRRVGLLAGFLTALYPPLILFTGRLLTETLGIFLFWLGLGLLVRGWRNGRWSWLAPAGVVLALACLTRPTLLPTVPFLAGAVVIAARPVPWRRRLLESTAFAAPLAGVLLAWNVLSSVDRPTVGAGGLKWMLNTIPQALSLNSRGWAPEGRPRPTDPPDPAYVEWLREGPRPTGWRAAAVANLVFYHVWYPENAWQENAVVSPEALNRCHRLLVLLGLGGLGCAAVRWRAFAPLLALAPPFALLSIKWIEIRHNLPFMPALFLLAALFVADLAEWLMAYWQTSPGRVKAALALGGTAALSLTLYWGTRLSRLAELLPSASPMTLGGLGDAAILVLALAWGTVLAWLAAPSLGRARAAVAGFLPAGLYAVLFSSYAFVGSEPRWQSWGVDCNRLPGPVVQEVTLPGPLQAEQIESAEWLVDLQTDADPPPLRVAVNGKWLEPGLYSWGRLLCPPDQSPYGTFATFAGRPLSSCPQWWTLRVDPATVGQKAILRLELAGEDAGDRGQRVCVAGMFCRRPTDPFRGPGIQPHFSRSLFRWVVAGDWRLTATTPLGSIATRSSLPPTGGPGEQADPEEKTLSHMVDRGYGRFNIRLLVQFKDGRQVIY